MAGSFAPRGQMLRWTGWFALVQVALASLISARYFVVEPLAADPLPLAFAPLMVIGHQATMVFLVALPVLVFAAILPWRRALMGSGVVLGAAFLLFLIVDTFVFAQYRFHINGAIWGLITGGAAGEIFEFSAVMYVAAALVIAILLAVETWLAVRVWRWVVARPQQRTGYLVAVFVFLAVFGEKIAYAWADAAEYSPITRQVRYLPAYQPTQAKTHFARWGVVAPSGDRPKLQTFQSALSYPLAPIQCEAANKPNVVVIVIDSWRGDAFTADVTPNITRFARDAVVFENHLSGGNGTRPGIFSLFYGIPATYWEAALAEKKGSVVVDTLVAQGYTPAIFGSAKLYSPEFDRTVFASVKDLRQTSPGRNAVERDLSITKEFLQFMDRRKPNEPFFGFLFYDAPHNYAFPEGYELPFTPSWEHVNYLALDNDTDPTEFRNRYRNSVHFVDSMVARVLARLARLDNTIVVITGDHGQEFNDNRRNYWGHASNYSRAQIHVPLVVRWPGRAPQRIGYETTHFDVAPTLLAEALGCRNPSTDYSVGRSLFTPSADRSYLLTAYTNDFAVRKGALVEQVQPTGDTQLFRDDGTYAPVVDPVTSAKLLRTGVEEMGRYYAGGERRMETAAAQ